MPKSRRLDRDERNVCRGIREPERADDSRLSGEAAIEKWDALDPFAIDVDVGGADIDCRSGNGSSRASPPATVVTWRSQSADALSTIVAVRWMPWLS